MATKYHNLSAYNADELPNADVLKRQRFAIAVADWNSEITYALLEGAYDTLVKHGVQEQNIKVVHVPGTFELTYAANKLQQEHSYDAIIAIGCVIQGDTPHFDYICQGVSYGLSKLNAEDFINFSKRKGSVIFSVLTTLTKQQALDRAGGVLGNKGVEGAITAIKMANIDTAL
ncbi:MAG: 6,7-dimethyl-8-ribityllumazine synthase [Paludibacteraceae bacterium]|nr:6,7-dimethyl-8-ribityllumazine synthase [Paludibacteraceae bacterium]MBO7233653.1 6,7-dimethyl-8-ribityllumazine synthase [Paludibacteraceae bacterium]MBO7259494.1 6,7-dimethyl-8-ribityllumazine synthase [Paludibacteraceae bacterium]